MKRSSMMSDPKHEHDQKNQNQQNQPDANRKPIYRDDPKHPEQEKGEKQNEKQPAQPRR